MQPPHELDLHDDYDFLGLEYSVEQRTLRLRWRRSPDRSAPGTPATLAIEFRAVSEFRFQPRDPELPLSEDDCVSSFGYWTGEEWATDGMICPERGDPPGPEWLTAIELMSGARIGVQAESAHARIEP